MRPRYRCLRLEPLEQRCCPSNFDKIGTYRQAGDGVWSLDANGDGAFSPADTVYAEYSGAGVSPVVGDWNGDSRDEVGFFVDGIWHLDVNGNGKQDKADQFFFYGSEGDRPVVGNWQGNGVRPGVFTTGTDGAGRFIFDTNNNRELDVADQSFTFGVPGDTVVIGDWTGDGRTKVGVFRPHPDGSGAALFSLDLNGNRRYDGGGEAFTFGAAGDGFVIGDWANSGTKNLGVYRPHPDGSGTGYFTLDSDGDRAYTPGLDRVFSFGVASDKFIVGNWAFNPLRAVEPGPRAVLPALTQDMLNATIVQALDVWAKTGLDSAGMMLLKRTLVVVADLPGDLLAVQRPDAIVIDADAAGWGWSANGTGSMDLVHVVRHEQGHVLGLADEDHELSSGLMADVLAPAE